MKRKVFEFLYLLLLFCLIGCARTLRLKVSDASTGKPLAGVSLSLSEFRADMLHHAGEFPRTNIPCSDNDGIIIVNRFHGKRWLSQFAFSQPGYSNGYAQYEGNRFRFSTQMTNSHPYPIDCVFSNVFVLRDTILIPKLDAGFFLISLSKLGTN